MREWQELVDEGRRIESGRNWALGDLALEVQTAYGEQTLERFADEVGVPYESLRDYRFVASRYESALRNAHLAWSVYKTFAPLDDRHDVIGSRPQWTVAAARDFVAHRKSVVREVTEHVDRARLAIADAIRVVTDVGLDAAKREELRPKLQQLADEVGALLTNVFAGDVDVELRNLLGGAR